MRIRRRTFIEFLAVSAAMPMPAFAQTGRGGRFIVTGDSVDPRYADPVIEINEDRNTPEPHRYVHGSFKGTNGKFSFYFPPKARYQGRFFHNTYPLMDNADVGPLPNGWKINEGNIGFAFDSGAYLVQTNQDGGPNSGIQDPSISSGYRVNAAAAKLSRVIAAQVYGQIPRPYGYIHGGSGGSLQVQGAADNTSGVWDGFLPFCMGCAYSRPSRVTVMNYAKYILSKRNKFPEILDALEPGGSGDPYATLNEEERGALREATRMGVPLRAWWQYEVFSEGGGGAGAADPTYTDDFWSKPGHLGTDSKSSIRNDRIQFETTVSKVTAGSPATVDLTSVPDRNLAGSQLVIVSGAAAGRSLPMGRLNGKTLTLGGGGGGGAGGAAPNLQPGDKVRIDNSASLAYLTYHRHILPPPDYYAWNQFRGPDGKPLYPQRPVPLSPSLSSIGSLPDGHVAGKVLVMQAMMDRHAFAWQGDWYKTKIKEAMGPKSDNCVVWFIDNAQHDVPGFFGTEGQEKQAWARTVSHLGALQQGLRDLAAWAEKGVKPSETQYKMVDTQVQLPAAARERHGIQPVVTLQANGRVRTEVAVNKPVKFAGTIEVPPKAGKVVAVEWDFEGTGDRSTPEPLRTPQAKVNVKGEHTYTKPGTYFALLRVFSHRDGDAKTPYAQIQNLARVRVIVS